MIPTQTHSAPPLEGRQLVITRLIWLTLVALTIGLFIAGIPARYAEMQQPCAESVQICSDRLIPTAAEISQMAQEGMSPQTYASIWIVINVFPSFVFWGVGLVIFAVKPMDRGAFLISFTLISIGTSSVVLDALARQHPAFHLPTQSLNWLRLVLFAVLFAAFPNGRIVPRAMWIVIGLWGIRNFIRVFWPDPTGLIATLTDLTWLVFWLSGIAAQIYRYLYVSTTDERRQTKWVVFGLALLVTIIILTVPFFIQNETLTQGVSVQRLAFDSAFSIVVLLIPVTLAVAILRNRLWDIDIIIRKTLQYSVVTGLLGLVYFGSVVLLQKLFFGSQTSEIAIVLSTLLIAGLFNPLRRRIQDFIDGRFYRKKYDPAQVLASFTQTCQNETNMEALTAELLHIIQETMQPGTVTMWLKPTADNQKTNYKD